MISKCTQAFNRQINSYHSKATFDFKLNILASENTIEAPGTNEKNKNTDKNEEDHIEVFEDDENDKGNESSEGEYTSTDHSDGSYEEYHNNSSEESLSEREHL